MYVMGEDSQKRTATESEIEQMCALVKDAMASGAVGVSSSHVDADEFGNPVPSRYADMAEKVALAAAMREAGEQHRPGTGRGMWEIVPLLFGEGQLESIR